MLGFTGYQMMASSTFLKLIHNHRMYNKYGERIILTGRGWLSYSTIDHEVFRGFDYYMSENTVPIPRLKYLKEPTCETVFNQWSRLQNRSKLIGPLDDLPKDEGIKFGMYYTGRKYQKFREYEPVQNDDIWDEIEEWARQPSEEIFHIGKGEHISVAMYNSMQYHNMTGQQGMIYGSRTPWLEAFALNLGARELLSVGRHEIEVFDTSRVTYLTSKELAEEYNDHVGIYDFAASYSAVEHVGLGRYGEVIDPIGDIREIQKMHCLLKPGGILFLGIPRGQDIIVYNRRIIYGRMRLAMIMTGFEWVSTFRGAEKTPVTLTLDDLDGYDDKSGLVHDVFVLKKI